MTTAPSLTILNPQGQSARTLLVLHGNDGTPEAMRPLYEDLTEQGWRVALACSGQPNPEGSFRWNDLQAADQATAAWVQQLGVMPYWAGFSAGAYIALRAVLRGQLPGRGVLAAIPSIPSHPDWWPQGWASEPVIVPVAFVVGETDEITPPQEVRAFADRIAVQNVPTRVLSHAGGHEHSAQWPELRREALQWLVSQG